MHRISNGIHDVQHARSGVEHPVNTCIQHALNIFLRNDPSDVDADITAANVLTCRHKIRNQHVMGVAHHRRRYAIHIFVACCNGQRSWRLPESGVDHMDATVTKCPRNQFDTSIMPIEAHLAEEHPGPVCQLGAAVDLLEGRSWLSRGAWHGNRP